MAKARKQPVDKRGPLQKALDAERGPIVMVGPKGDQKAAYLDQAPLVNGFAAQHGLYLRNLKHVENAGCTTVKRWEAAKLLEASQLAAIAHCLRLWEAACTTRGMVVDLERVRGGEGYGDGLKQQEAINDLKRISGGHDITGTFKPGYIPQSYWSVFENCVRFDEPGGYSGSRLAEQSRGAMKRVLTIVQFTADIITQHERLSY
jgi:hypothetical protein